MSINFLQGILYGFISGLTEFLPISSQAHQAMLRQAFGMNQRDPVLDMLVHSALLLVLLYAFNTVLSQNRGIRTRSGRFNSHASRASMNRQLIKNAALPMLLCMLLLYYITKGNDNLLLSSVFLLVNGIILYLPSRMLQGNKDVRSMSYGDSLLIGILSGFGVICGISRVAVTTTVSIARGADRQHALNWSLMLSIYAVALLVCYDFVGIFTQISTIPFWSNFAAYIAAFFAAFGGGFLSIRIIRTLCRNSVFSNFAFYSWGLALLAFFMYLTVV